MGGTSSSGDPANGAVDQQAQFTSLINELMRMNYHQIANQPASANAKNTPSNGTAPKGRANSEKTANTSNVAPG